MSCICHSFVRNKREKKALIEPNHDLWPVRCTKISSKESYFALHHTTLTLSYDDRVFVMTQTVFHWTIFNMDRNRFYECLDSISALNLRYSKFVLVVSIPLWNIEHCNIYRLAWVFMGFDVMIFNSISPISKMTSLLFRMSNQMKYLELSKFIKRFMILLIFLVALIFFPSSTAFANASCWNLIFVVGKISHWLNSRYDQRWKKFGSMCQNKKRRTQRINHSYEDGDCDPFDNIKIKILNV